MRSSKVYLLIMIFLLGAAGAGGAMLAVHADAALSGSIISIDSALARAGEIDNASLREAVHAGVLKQKEFWTIIGIGGVVTAVLSLLALVIAAATTK